MRDPLWELQKAVYTRLSDNLGAAVYDWLPDPPSYPYVLMENEQSGESNTFKGGSESLAACEVQLLAASLSKGGQELKELVDAIATAMETRLTVADNWSVVRQLGRPTVRTRRVTFNDGSQGRAAEIVYTFDIQDTE